MTLDLFAGLPVADLGRARPWYEGLFGAEPAFIPHDAEAVWELDEHRFVYVVEDRERAGGGLVTLFVADLEQRVAAIAARGIEPDRRETYSNGVRKVTYRDGDGNEVGLGGAPAGD